MLKVCTAFSLSNGLFTWSITDLDPDPGSDICLKMGTVTTGHLNLNLKSGSMQREQFLYSTSGLESVSGNANKPLKLVSHFNSHTSVLSPIYQDLNVLQIHSERLFYLVENEGRRFQARVPLRECGDLVHGASHTNYTTKTTSCRRTSCNQTRPTSNTRFILYPLLN